MCSGRTLSFITNTARRYWLFALLLFPPLIPPYSSRGYALTDWAVVNQYILFHPIKADLAFLFPIFKIIPVLILTGLFLHIKPAARLLYGYMALFFALAGILQSVSISARWGLAVCTGNLVTFLFLSFLWGREAIRNPSRLVFRQEGFLQYWPVWLALIPFWYPVNPQTLLPDFNPQYLITSGAGLSFCLTTPLFLAVFLMSTDNTIHLPTACLAFVGLYMGLSNLALEWIILPEFWWIGVLHLPLAILSGKNLLRVFPPAPATGGRIV